MLARTTNRPTTESSMCDVNPSTEPRLCDVRSTTESTAGDVRNVHQMSAQPRQPKHDWRTATNDISPIDRLRDSDVATRQRSRVVWQIPERRPNTLTLARHDCLSDARSSTTTPTTVTSVSSTMRHDVAAAHDEEKSGRPMHEGPFREDPSMTDQPGTTQSWRDNRMTASTSNEPRRNDGVNLYDRDRQQQRDYIHRSHRSADPERDDRMQSVEANRGIRAQDGRHHSDAMHHQLMSARDGYHRSTPLERQERYRRSATTSSYQREDQNGTADQFWQRKWPPDEDPNVKRVCAQQSEKVEQQQPAKSQWPFTDNYWETYLERTGHADRIKQLLTAPPRSGTSRDVQLATTHPRDALPSNATTTSSEDPREKTRGDLSQVEERRANVQSIKYDTTARPDSKMMDEQRASMMNKRVADLLQRYSALHVMISESSVHQYRHQSKDFTSQVPPTVMGIGCPQTDPTITTAVQQSDNEQFSRPSITAAAETTPTACERSTSEDQRKYADTQGESCRPKMEQHLEYDVDNAQRRDQHLSVPQMQTRHSESWRYPEEEQ